MALLPSVEPQNVDADMMAGEDATPVAAFLDRPKNNKCKYQCSGCGAAVWGKAGLNIRCADCDRDFGEI
ncbi:TPA: hypothetical protein ACWDRI_004634 [Yersinia enterocolitica]|uniref:Uncharacterized protein n=1 Tax=Citrobacter portucalensis TaxID=1639133 RepID=A0A9X4GRF3_9ENTR|nr:hypothetical protein [Citrobacter portucalensis]MDE9621458.1 hypothetical protein [Citrobacter portucalensis]